MWAPAILIHLLILIGQGYLQPAMFTFPNGPSTNASGLQIDSSGRVFVSAGNKLFRLSPDLVEEENISLSADIIFRGVALSEDGKKVVVCLDDLSCAVYNASDLAKGPVFGTFNNSIRSYSPILFAAGDTFYVGSIGYGLNSTQETIELGQYGFGEEVFNRTITYGITKTGFERNFGRGFVIGGFAYYFVYDNSLSNGMRFRVMRVCHATDCHSGTSCSFQTLYEAEFQCFTPMSGGEIGICDVSVIDNWFRPTDTTVLVIICDYAILENNNGCLLNLTEINCRMDEKYDSCIFKPSGESTEVVWLDNRVPCKNLTATSRCEFSHPLDDIKDPPILGVNSVFEYSSASIFVLVESVPFLFVSYRISTTFFGVLGGYVNVQSNSSILTYMKQLNDEIQTLSWIPGSYHVIAASKVSVFQIPIEECSSHVNCPSCTADPNPLCGWCVVENKCSRQSQCQNINPNTTVWWTQNSTECLFLMVNPYQYILDIHQLLSVSINSPGLPVLLTDKTYSCHLADSEGRFSFTVPAVEISPRTNYTCDIHGMVSTYQGVTSVINFSFVYSLFGIRFITTNDALRIYNCSGASSCSECLSDSNPCGWCNYNKVCSGTDTPCRNASAYIKISGNAFEEVCPLLAPPPSGTYIQPVRVAQDIQFYTMNLPAPVDGFQYMCAVNDVFLSAVYQNKTSITCTAESGDLTLSASVGSSSVEVSLVWTGNGINHPIDHLVERIEVNLYNCQVMADDCSPCISSRLSAKFMCGWCDTSCEVEAECLNRLVTSGNDCPVPVITSFSPTSGPVEGGTSITISGTNLGVTFSDISSSTLLLGGVPCVPVESDYITGTQFVCETTDFSNPGYKYFVLVIGNRTSSILASTFQALKPTLSKVVPSSGPMAGGSLVTVRGSKLDIGNPKDTYVFLDGQSTSIISIIEGEIKCRTSPGVVDSSPTEPVMVLIDNAMVINDSVSFTYLNNPNITRVFPQNTIPSGGIELIFSGQSLDAVQTPVLVILFSDGHTMSSNCTSMSLVSISCITPLLLSNESISNYTIILDGAPPTYHTQPGLQLTVQPDPSNFTLQTKTVIAGSETIIRITGENLNSVLSKETRVMVGGQLCVLSSPTSDSELLCTAPLQPPGGQQSVEVRVMIGRNIDILLDRQLVYDSNPPPLDIIISIIVVIIIVLIFGIIVIIILRVIYKRKHISIQNMEIKDHDGRAHQSFLMNSCLLSEMNEFMEQLPDSLKIPNAQLTIESTAIGQGEFGVVYKALLTDWKSTGFQHVAVKTLKGMSSSNDVQSLLNEVVKMQDFKHHCVMSLIGVCLNTKVGISIVMPYMANGSLLDYLKKERYSLELDDDSEIDNVMALRKLLLIMCHQISLGMQYLSHQKFIHRDLAARNCMLDNDGSIKVGDFGLAEDVYSTGYFRQTERESVKLPFKWMAPESLNDAIFTDKTDVWSYGVTMWEIFSGGRTPYPAVDPMSLMQMLYDRKRLDKPENAACTSEIFSVMRKCWRTLADNRPDFTDLVSDMNRLLEPISEYTILCMNLTEDKGEIGCEEICQQGSKSPEDVDVPDNVAYGTSGDLDVVDNVAYGTSENVDVPDNVAYSTSGDLDVTDNVAYGTSENVDVPEDVAYGTSENVDVTDNVAYGT